MKTLNNHIIIFDGVCNFCNAVVNFVLKRDIDKRYMFTPMHGPFAKSIIEKYNENLANVDTIILIKNNNVYTHSEAALEIAKDIKGFRFLAKALKIIPISFRDYLYKVFAKNRYKIFGKRETCIIPNDEVKDRFL